MECALGRVAACRDVSTRRCGVAVEQVAGYRDLLRTPGVGAHHGRAADGAIPERHDEPRDPAAHRVRHRVVRCGRARARPPPRSARPSPGRSRAAGWASGACAACSTTTLVICALAITAIALVETIVPVYMVLGLIAGLSTPPVQSAVRTIYPKMVNSRQLTPLFSFDASLQEVIWIVAPVRHHPRRDAGRHGAGAAAHRRDPDQRRGVVHPLPRGRARSHPAQPPQHRQGARQAAGAAGDGHRLPADRRVRRGRGGRRRDVRRTAASRPGIVLAIFSIGSLAGGLSFGHIPIGRWAMARRLAIVAVGLCAHGLLAQHLLARRHARSSRASASRRPWRCCSR